MTTTSTYPTFCTPDDTASIWMCQTDDSTPDSVATLKFTENSSFEQHVSTTAMPKLRIVSINSKSSTKPLQISKCALQALMDCYEIGDDLWDLASTFGDKPMSFSVGEGAMKIQNRDNAIQAGLRHWTMRQIAVFHHHDPHSLKNLWIFFHVGANTPMQKELERYASENQQGLSSDHTWFSMHSGALSSCLKNWHEYIHYLGRDVDGHTDKSLDFVMRNIDHVLTAGGDSNLTAIHYTRDRLLPTTHRIGVILETLTTLGKLSHALDSSQSGRQNGYLKLANFLAYHQRRLEGLVVGIEVLKEAVKDTWHITTIGLDYTMTSQMLNLNNRMVELNNRMLYSNEQLLRLGTRNFDDNATVKVVTILTLIYLPASLVSSVFGMNLFKFDDGTTEELRISKQFWIFVVATIILAAITITIWYLWTHKERITRQMSHDKKDERSKDTERDI
ncbi:unnamed protein product [Penicillium olsonii]|uniref:CorA-like transporter domain-containing protein n=1 Tax=Penicillium olsonii TaxID=99116 RepID=A0A9W4N131_PENOL|nr:unnamed protein product [Penicillium olsonii]CAG8259243.1 unnamed protein product [Penicillium olsonii]